MSIKMLIFDYSEVEKDYFKNHKLDDFEIDFFESSLNEKTVNNLPDYILDETTVISVFKTSRINADVLGKFKNLLIITTRSRGYEHINLEDCCKRHIKVLNVEQYGVESAVEYTLAMILILTRNIIFAINDVKSFKLSFERYKGRQLKNLTLGILGTGHIGKELCKFAGFLGMKVLAYDIKPDKELIKNCNMKYTDKNTLFMESDVITLNLPLNDTTRNTVTRLELSKMKSTSYIINISHGELINTEDLYNSLVNKKIAGAALDTTECEKYGIIAGDTDVHEILKNPDCINKTVFTRRLAMLENVILTPHIAYNTKEATKKMLDLTIKSIEECLQGGHSNQVN